MSQKHSDICESERLLGLFDHSPFLAKEVEYISYAGSQNEHTTNH